MHPLMEDLSIAKTDVIQNRLEELTKKYWSTTNIHVQEQIILAIDTFKVELENRKRQELKNITQEKDLDNLINIS